MRPNADLVPATEAAAASRDEAEEVPSAHVTEVSVAEVDDGEDRSAHARLRWPWRVGAGAICALYTSTLLHPRAGQPLVVLFDIDGYGWSFLFGATTVLSTAAFLGGVVHLLTRRRSGFWSGLVRDITPALLTIGLLAGAPLALLGGALSFKNSYRDVGVVDDHAIVVQQFAGWRGADFLDAGYRNGALVSFDARSDSTLSRTFTDIDSWHFSITTTPTTVSVHYRSSDRPSQTGTLTFPRNS